MTDNAQMTIADVADRHRIRVAAAALSMSFMFLTRAVTHVVDAVPARNLGYLVPVFAVLAVALVVPTVVGKLRNLRRLPQGERYAYFNRDGFVNDIFSRAQRVSWTVTFLMLMLLDVVVSDRDSSGYLTTLPLVFYLQLTIGVMLGVMASVFLILNQADGADDAEDGARA